VENFGGDLELKRLDVTWTWCTKKRLGAAKWTKST